MHAEEFRVEGLIESYYSTEDTPPMGVKLVYENGHPLPPNLAAKYGSEYPFESLCDHYRKTHLFGQIEEVKLTTAEKIEKFYSKQLLPPMGVELSYGKGHQASVEVHQKWGTHYPYKSLRGYFNGIMDNLPEASLE